MRKIVYYQYKILFIMLSLFLCTSIDINAQDEFIFGADLSYVNEIEDCGGKYFDHGREIDPFLLFKKYGANLVRVRLWHTPTRTSYSNFKDVVKTIRRAKKENLKVLLDFHYSDDWADPQKQIIPKAWAGITDQSILLDSMYNYTYQVIHDLDSKGLMPEMVQIGNEINNEILMHRPYEEGDTINWKRNIALINKAIQAVHDAASNSSVKPKIMIHIAQPENALKWFDIATKNHLADFDIIGISYYSKWSEYAIGELSEAIKQLNTKYHKDVIVAETAYPWTLKNYDTAANVLGEDALVDEYPASPEGQYQYMIDLTKAIIKGGGKGIIYWEPAWITSPCQTPWGKGSHWENAAFFNPDTGEPLPVMKFFMKDYNTIKK